MIALTAKSPGSTHVQTIVADSSPPRKEQGQARAISAWPSWQAISDFSYKALKLGLAYLAVTSGKVEGTQVKGGDYLVAYTKANNRDQYHTAITEALGIFPQYEVQGHVVPTQDGLPTKSPYLRNQVEIGKDKVVISPGDTEATRKMSADVKSFLKKNDIPFESLKNPSNMANVFYDRDLDLLVVGQMPLSDLSRCNEHWLSSLCTEKMNALHMAFGKPKHTINLMTNVELVGGGYFQGQPICYDLDVFAHLTTNGNGEKMLLVYSPCIAESSGKKGKRQDPGMQKMERKNVLEKFKKMGVEVIEVGKSDFDNLACNAVTIKPGKILFTGPITPDLRKKLEEKNMEVVVSKKFLGNKEEKVGIHCLTAGPLPPPKKASSESKKAHDEL